MKHYLSILILLCCFSISNAQAPLKEDDNQISAGSGYSNTGIPVFLSYELMIYNNISFGAEGSTRFFKEKSDSANYKHNYIGLAFFSNYYFNSLLNLGKEMGLYGGLHVGFYKKFSPDGYMLTEKNSSTLAAGAQIGYRYYFKDFAVYIEGTGDTQYFGGKLGLSYKFR